MFTFMRALVTAFAARMHGQHGRHGQGMLEYTLIMLFIILVVFGGLIVLGPQIAHVFGGIHNTL